MKPKKWIVGNYYVLQIQLNGEDHVLHHFSEFKNSLERGVYTEPNSCQIYYTRTT